MKFIVLTSILLFLGCSSTDFNYMGTTGSRYGISPYPSKERWGEILKSINSADTKAYKPVILWVVGTYQNSNIILNYPGIDRPQYGILYSELDMNEEYLKYFDKNGIDVYLTIEPGHSRISQVIRTITNKYSKHKSIKGICIDLEWYKVDENNKFGKQLDQKSIKSIMHHLKEADSNFKLILKHWNINNIEHYLDDDILYLQSLEGVDSLEVLKIRYVSWYKKFYPSKVGMQIYYNKKEDFGLNGNTSFMPRYINDIKKNPTTILWSESSIKFFK